MGCRHIDSHIVPGLGTTQEQVQILVRDDPGQGGANHQYVISHNDKKFEPMFIQFQNGPIKEFGVNGLTNEALLAVVEDRMKGFQSGQFACRENAIALTHIQEALMWLQRRTTDRVRRNVEGTNNK